jgi:hypothetical protein
MKLWPKAKLRAIRFHDLRHTTASLLMMSGANPAAVQRILRHADPRITTEVYGHLAPNYLRAEVDRLRFFPDEEALLESVPVAVNAQLGPRVVQASPKALLSGPTAITNPRKNRGFMKARPVRFERTTGGLEGRCSIQLSYGRVTSRTITRAGDVLGKAERGGARPWIIASDIDSHEPSISRRPPIPRSPRARTR